MIRTHGNLMIGAARTPPMRLFLHHGQDHAHYIRTAGQVLRFVKGSVCLSGYSAKVHEVNASAESRAIAAKSLSLGSVGSDAKRGRSPACRKRQESLSHRPRLRPPAAAHMGPGGSSGCMARRALLLRDRTTSRRNAMRCLRNSSAATPWYSAIKPRMVLAVVGRLGAGETGHGRFVPDYLCGLRHGVEARVRCPHSVV